MSKVFIIMGVSGCGKSTVGIALAKATEGRFIDADDLHSAGNVAKMRSGTPLTDDDRKSWLHDVNQVARRNNEYDHHLFIACSALKRSYRDILRNGLRDLSFVFLDAPKSLLLQRLNQRTGHYMPASLLQSQLEILEPPTLDEQALTVDVTRNPTEITKHILKTLLS